MEKSPISLNKIELVGIEVRTSNNKEFNPQAAKIKACIQHFIS
ncbi:MAG: hypothetical protein O7C59_03805 [Rickettsia endosymbiont of Ixodes persulcatus]|nr:hypothetical protein [Rickettsia endosymbiont of Ixodes persulcatus]MCZ6903494.1 hypothetical protein [Rickettsia endosymbiont of Ixodes persulcatus]MCZ6908682.1 hypothetical protein [Rickettsia endosymbiont of Ixodes persulcatus]MCZ6909989.1 hypothetical protein [Rickettsia endosymbiont of Ixodes persulcatus]MCZ6913679.1 hypothetical protein [Rickettsia endosymbiont of Ixodes persulcatus]